MDKIKAGDFKDIDEYVKELREQGYDTEYENVVSDITGFVARLYVNEEEHAVWEGKEGGQMVKKVVTPLHEI